MSVSFLYQYIIQEISRDSGLLQVPLRQSEALTAAWPVPHIAWRWGKWRHVMSWMTWEWHGMTCHGRPPFSAQHPTHDLMISHAFSCLFTYHKLCASWEHHLTLMTTSAGKRHSPGSTNGLQVQDLSRETIELTIYDLWIENPRLDYYIGHLWL